MTVKEKKETAEVKKESPESKNNAGFSCYIGPNIPGVIQSRTIYPKGRDDVFGLPEVKFALTKNPEIADLIVDGTDLSKALDDVQKPGSDLYRFYHGF